MQKIRPAKLRQILWKRMKWGSHWWLPKYKFANKITILNEDWILNLRATFRNSNEDQSRQVQPEGISSPDS